MKHAMKNKQSRTMIPTRDVFGNLIPTEDLFRHLHGPQLFNAYGQHFHDLSQWDYFVTLTFQKSMKPFWAWKELNIWIRNIQKTTQQAVDAVILLDLKNPDNAHFHGLLTVPSCPGTQFLDDTWRTRELRAREKLDRKLSVSDKRNYYRGHAHIRAFDPNKKGAWYIANRLLNDNSELKFYGKFMTASEN